MTRIPSRFVGAMTVAALLAAPVVARAQAVTPSGSRLIGGSGPPAPTSAEARNADDVARPTQQTQPKSLPQSVSPSGPRIITNWDEDRPVPYGYHPEARMRTGPIVGGAIAFGVAYGVSLSIALIGWVATKSSGEDNPVRALYIPAVGPFLQMSRTDDSAVTYFLAADGAAQIGGAIVLLWGLTSSRNVLVRNDLVSTRVTPMRMGSGGIGLGLTGSF